MSLKIELVLDKTVTRLAGYELGKKIFNEQVKEKINYNEKTIIVFPNNITKLASSFIQGFFGEMVEKIGIAGIEKQIIIESSNEDLRDSIIKNLL
ncbi:DUF4325 domain-containing protein [Clostridium sp. AF12-19]|nr:MULTISPECIES: DUF4325 domain-containing protein [unclassified Clostridium]RHS23354.1 DUF4325 domain-containing protein [Clostridium sp. AF12-19]RHS25209.1 DUF4325 domain-containing protein [Clostridium sp. AF12-28]